MNPQQPPQQPTNTQSPQPPPTVPEHGAPVVTQPSDHPQELPQQSPPAEHRNNAVPLAMVAGLFVLLIAGGILAYAFRPQSQKKTTIPLPAATPTALPEDTPAPSMIPTKTPEEKEIEAIDIGSDEAIFTDISDDIKAL